MPLPTRADREWPIGRLDLRELANTGWRPSPIRQFIVKIHSRCNLACAYCYVYEKGDQSWRARPPRMSEETVALTARRVAEHASAHQLTKVEVVLHGGEPLLAGTDFITWTVGQLRAALPVGTTLDVTVQTNGVLLDVTMLDALSALGIRIGVSLDGTAAAHDRYRRFPDGRPSFGRVAEGIRLLAEPAYRSSYGGILCTVDLSQDPIAAYETLLRFQPPRMDFLLPHGNWTDPPPGRPADDSAPYADWLRPIFDRWYPAPPPSPSIRLFEEIIQLLIGGHSRTESVGLSPATLLVIETDGAMEQVDTLRAAYAGAASTGLHIARNAIDDAFGHPGIVARQIGIEALADECRECSVRRVCGGGFYGHRYRAGEGFRNPSVFCADMLALIRHIHAAVSAELRRIRRSA